MQLEQSFVEKIIAHKIGNKMREEKLFLSQNDSEVSESLSSVLLSNYLKNIISDKNKYQFHHENDLTLNEVRCHINNYFSGDISFIELSKKISIHLYEKLKHPNIKAGELLVILFNNIKVEGNFFRAIGLFKSDAPDNYISVSEQSDGFAISIKSGINPSLIDKGALIFEKSLDVFAVDRLNNKTKFWIDDFLQIKKTSDPITCGKVIAYAARKISNSIEDPIKRQGYNGKILELCENEENIDISLIKDQSSDFIADSEWDSIIKDADRIYGSENFKSISAPSNKIEKSVKRIMSQIDIGYGIKINIPETMKIIDIHNVKNTNGEIVFAIKVI